MTKTRRTEIKNALKVCKDNGKSEQGVKVVKYTSLDRKECAMVKVVDWGKRMLKSTTAEIVKVLKGFRDCEPGDIVQIDPRGLEPE